MVAQVCMRHSNNRGLQGHEVLGIKQNLHLLTQVSGLSGASPSVTGGLCVYNEDSSSRLEDYIQ